MRRSESESLGSSLRLKTFSCRMAYSSALNLPSSMPLDVPRVDPLPDWWISPTGRFSVSAHSFSPFKTVDTPSYPDAPGSCSRKSTITKRGLCCQ